MKVKKIYLDMDGVLSDFHKRYAELFGENAAGEDRPNKKSSENWKEFVKSGQFETLDWFPGGQELLTYVFSLGLPIEILSSTGGPKYHSEVRKQKIRWLLDKDILLLEQEKIALNIVPGRRVKRFYSFSGNILIDDTEDVVEEFNQYGGTAILHKNVNTTITTLESLLNK